MYYLEYLGPRDVYVMVTYTTLGSNLISAVQRWKWFELSSVYASLLRHVLDVIEWDEILRLEIRIPV